MDFRPANFGLPRLSVLELSPGTRQADERSTDGQTNTAHHFVLS